MSKATSKTGRKQLAPVQSIHRAIGTRSTSSSNNTKDTTVVSESSSESEESQYPNGKPVKGGLYDHNENSDGDEEQPAEEHHDEVAHHEEGRRPKDASRHSALRAKPVQQGKLLQVALTNSAGKHVAAVTAPSSSASKKRPAPTVGKTQDVLASHQAKRPRTTKEPSPQEALLEPSTPTRPGSGATGIPLPGTNPALISAYSPPTKRVLQTAKQHFMISISMINGFPSEVLKIEFANKAIAYANAQTREDIELLDGSFRVLMDISSTFRGKIKASAVTLVKSEYRLAGLDREAMKARIIELKDLETFIYLKVRPSRQEGERIKRTIPFMHGCITAVLFDIYYTGSEPLARLFEAQFTLIPLELIALVVTAIRCALDCYKTGDYHMVSFDLATYSGPYNMAKKALTDFNTKAKVKCLEMQAFHASTLSERAGFTVETVQEEYELNYDTDSSIEPDN